MEQSNQSEQEKQESTVDGPSESTADDVPLSSPTILITNEEWWEENKDYLENCSTDSRVSSQSPETQEERLKEFEEDLDGYSDSSPQTREDTLEDIQDYLNEDAAKESSPPPTV